MIDEATAHQLASTNELPFPKLVERIRATGGIPFAGERRDHPIAIMDGDTLTYRATVNHRDQRHEVVQTVSNPCGTYYGVLMARYPYGIAIIFVTEDA